MDRPSFLGRCTSYPTAFAYSTAQIKKLHRTHFPCPPSTIMPAGRAHEVGRVLLFHSGFQQSNAVTVEPGACRKWQQVFENLNIEVTDCRTTAQLNLLTVSAQSPKTSCG